MGAPRVVRLEDGTNIVELRRFVLTMIERRWPSKRTGKRGRPSGSGLAALARAMKIHPSRLSHIIKAADWSGEMRSADFDRIAHGLGLNGLELRNEYQQFWSEVLTTKES